MPASGIAAVHLVTPFCTETNRLVEVFTAFHAAERLFPSCSWCHLHAETLQFLDHGGIPLVLRQGGKR